VRISVDRGDHLRGNLGHGAANVTLGIPRLREIVMTASLKPKTPSMTIPMAKGVSVDQADTFARRASRVTLSQIIDSVTVDERLTINNRVRRKQFTIDIAFYPEEEYRAEFDVSPTELVGAFGTRFPLILKREIQLEMRKFAADLKSQIAELGKGKATPRGEEGASAAAGDVGEDADADAAEPGPRRDDDDESEVGDGDTTMEKRHRQKQQQASYESDEDEEVESDIEPLEADLEAAYALDTEGAANDEPRKKPGKKGGLKEVVRKTEEAFLGNFSNATAFNFSASRCTIELEVSGASRPPLCRIDLDSDIVWI
jgi:hypothetical protein